MKKLIEILKADIGFIIIIISIAAFIAVMIWAGFMSSKGRNYIVINEETQQVYEIHQQGREYSFRIKEVSE